MYLSACPMSGRITVMPCQAMSMVVVHVASGTRNILVFLGRMAEAMGHALQSHCDSMTIQVCPVRHTLAHRRRYPVPPSRSHPLALLSEETLQSTHRPGLTGREAGIMYPKCPEARLNFTFSQTLILFRKCTLRDKGRTPRRRAAAMSFWRNNRTSSLIAMPVVNIRQMILGTALSRSFLVLAGLLVRLSTVRRAEGFNVVSSLNAIEPSVCW